MRYGLVTLGVIASMQVACSSIPDVSERDYASIKDVTTREQSKKCGETIGRAKTRDSVYGIFTILGTGVGLAGTVFTKAGIEYGKDTLVPVVSIVSTSLSLISQIARGIDTGDVRDVYDKSYAVGLKLAMEAEEIEAKNGDATKVMRDENEALTAQIKGWESAKQELAGKVDEAGEKAGQLKALEEQISAAQAKMAENDVKIMEINADAAPLRQKAQAAFQRCDESIWF
jgi:hypothetical protein